MKKNAGKTFILSEKEALSLRWGNKSTEERCHFPDCDEPGIYPAPQSSSNLKKYFWFCLNHVRDYNARWHFGDDVPEDEKESLFNEQTRMSSARKVKAYVNAMGQRELLRRARFFRHHHSPPTHENNYPKYLSKNIVDALQLFDCPWPIDKHFLRKKYLGLVKNFHPDHHANDKKKSEKLKEITAAYHLLNKKILSF